MNIYIGEFLEFSIINVNIKKMGLFDFFYIAIKIMKLDSRMISIVLENSYKIGLWDLFYGKIKIQF